MYKHIYSTYVYVCLKRIYAHVIYTLYVYMCIHIYMYSVYAVNNNNYYSNNHIIFTGNVSASSM